MKIKALISLLILCSPYISNAQVESGGIVITGKITDRDQNPVKGATIFIDRVSTGVKTDTDGLYVVKASTGAREIIAFTFNNGLSREYIYRRSSIDLTLPAIPPAREETPVKVKAKKEPPRERGTIDTQKPEFASYSSIYDMIRGRLPGVTVSGTQIRVSGSSSLNVNMQPLFVVNGIIVSSIAHIEPRTVKTIQVLKGPDASEYGMRGAGGVILITLL
ncbi:MAG: TonB-dependent receptor plug domain-containing protein [Bacteroidales bacterium]